MQRMSSRRVHNQRGLNSRPPLKGATAVHSSANQKGNSPAGLLNKGMAVLRKIQQRQDNVQPPTAQPPATRGAGKPASVDLGVSKTKNQTSFKKGVQKSETLKVAAANRLARRSAQSGSGRNLTVVGQGISGKAISEKTTSGKGNSDKTTSGKTMSRKAISEKANSRKAMPASRRSNQPQQVSSRIPRRAGKSLHLEGAAVHSEAAPGSSKIPSVRAAPSKRLKAVSKVSNRKTRPPSSTSKTSGPPKQPPTTPEEPRKQVVDPPPLKREEVLVPPVPQPPPDINQQDVGPKPPEPVKLPDLKTGATIVPVTPVGQIDSPVNKLTVIQRNLMESLSNPVFKSVRRPPTGLKEEEVTKPAFRPDHNSHRPVAAVAAVAAAKALDTSHTSHVVPKKPDPDGPFLDYRHFRSIVPKHLYYALEQRVLAALSAQKTFAVIGGRNYGIEVALRKRGWVQKFAEPENTQSYLPGRVTRPPDDDSLVISKLMKRAVIKFFWIYGACNWSLINIGSIVNRFPFMNYSFSTKVGLCKILQEQHWTRKVGEQLVLYPRTFEVHSQDDLRHFVKKYRITACLALVPLDVVDFAVARLCEYVNFKESADLDVWDSSLVPQEEWTNFQEAYYSIVNETEQFNIGSIECVPKLVEACKKCVEAMKVYWPHMNMEGYRNVWIVKPGASNRGRGIVLENTLQGITNYCKNRNHYVIQKYIEKPLLVYSTKFDIRQWFLVTSVFPLTIWMYNQCYLRFSSQLFSLVNLDESVHLCNHSIQHKYKNCVRNSNLPNDNMWDDLQFVQYLSSQGQGEKWSSVVVPQMQDAIVGAVLASQDRMTHRPNSFSLYGADFLLSEDFSVWLLEINSQPDMGHTSKITARMCPEVLEDVCKVVVDRREDERASPGKFRLILRQKVSTNSGAASTANIMLSGKRMRIEKSGEYGPPLKSLQTNKDIDQPNKLKSLRTTNENSSLWRSIKYEKLAVYKNKSMKESTVREKPWLVTEGYSGRRPLEPGDATVPLPPKLPESPSSNVSPTVQFLEEKSSEDLSTRLQNALNQLTF